MQWSLSFQQWTDHITIAITRLRDWWLPGGSVAQLVDKIGTQGLSVDTLRSILGLALAVSLALHLIRAALNVSPLHPLYHIPGPRLAAATYLPEMYYDLVLYGRYTTRIREMHAKYGPIVRINPREVHCNDPAFVDEIYAAGGRKRDKPLHQLNGVILGAAGFSTLDHDLHRVRRGPLGKFFTRTMIARLERHIHDLVHALCDKLLRERGRRKPVDMSMAYSCFTTDAISEYCFGESFGLLAQPDWHPNWRAPTASLLKPGFAFRFFPFLKAGVPLASFLAPSLVRALPDEIALMVRTLMVDIPEQIDKTIADRENGIVRERPNIFASLLDSELPPQEKKKRRLADEAMAIVGAGTETTSWTLAVITYHLLSKPDLLDRLTAEVKQVVSDPRHLPVWTTLEKLPFLSAVIQEGLRLSYGVSARSSRVATGESLLYRGEWKKKPVSHLIPQGFAIGMSTAITHHDERVFPDSHSFDPDRWLEPSGRKDLDRAFHAFSKGTRSCLGMNLAYCELYLVLVALVLRVFPHMVLSDTDEEDVRYDHDMFLPQTKEERGVRVLLR